jgi:ATP-dependent Clp protease protease subunit
MLKDIEKYIYTSRFNHVYLYVPITDKSVLNISSRINFLNKAENNRGVYVKPKAIVLHINSPGGNLFSGIALMNVIHNSRIPVITYVEGMAASAATFVLVIAKYRIIAPEAVVLIHQLSTSQGGQHEAITFQAKVNDELMKIMTNFYTNYTKIPEKKLKEVLRHDIYFNSNECLKYGIVDKVMSPTSNTIFTNYFKRNPEYKLPINILKIKTNFNNLYFYGGDCNKENCKREEDEYDFRKITALQYVLSFDYNNKNGNKNNNYTNTNILTNTGTVKPILLQINETEPLMRLTDVLPLINTIMLSRIPVFSFINSPTTEKTLLYSILCYRRYIYKYASVIVDFMELFEGAEKHENTVKNTELTRKVIISILKKYTKLPEDILKNLFKDRFYFTADECVKYGICDAIVE